MKSSRPKATRPPRRIAICLPTMGGGGAERVALEIIRELLRAGHSVDLLLAQARGELLPLVPSTVRIVDLKAKRMLGAVSGLVRYFREEKPDAIQVSMWPLTTIVIVAHRLALSSAQLVTSDHIAFSQVKGREGFAFWLTAGLLYRFADKRIAVSEGVAADLASRTGLKRSDFEVIYNPVSPPPVLGTNAEADAIWDGARHRIITAGSLKPQKNHRLLLRAFAKLRRKDAKLVILGDGPLRGELEALSKTLGISSTVSMPGFRIDPWPYYASASVFVLSSDLEGLPLVLIEALAAGLPVVSTDCRSGPSEILDMGRFGRLVPCGDADALARGIDEALSESHDERLARERAAAIAGAQTTMRYLEVLGA